MALSQTQQQLSSLLQQGNYPAAFQYAQQNGALQDLYDPSSLQQLVPGGIPMSQYGSFINAFAPYESSLSGQADPSAHGNFGIGTAAWSQNDNLGQRTQNALTESQNMQAAEQANGLAPQKTPLQQAIGNDDVKPSSNMWGQHSNMNGVSGLGGNVPDLSSVFAATQGNSAWNNAEPGVLALASVLAPALIGPGGGAGADAGASTADAAAPVATDVAAPTEADVMATAGTPALDTSAPALGAGAGATAAPASGLDLASAGYGGAAPVAGDMGSVDVVGAPMAGGAGDVGPLASAAAPAANGYMTAEQGAQQNPQDFLNQPASSGSTTSPSKGSSLLSKLFSNTGNQGGSGGVNNSPLSALIGLLGLGGQIAGHGGQNQPANFQSVPGSALASYGSGTGSSGGSSQMNNPYSYMSPQYGFQPRVANPAMQSPGIDWTHWGEHTAAQNPGGGQFFIPQSPLQIVAGGAPQAAQQNQQSAMMSGMPGPTMQPLMAGMAEGGHMADAHPLQQYSEQHVHGPGDGRSDDIPAMLSNGEYVIDAETVSHLGDGSNEAGAQKLDRMRENIRKHKGAALAKGKISPDAKEAHAYLP